MKLELPKPGVYVVAVSGGVDSMVLLDLVNKLGQQNSSFKFIVAHLDHGIRPDSYIDKDLVENKAKELNIEFIAKKVNLGKDASEEEARKVRYKFLSDVLKQKKALAILTAHHEDDLIETAIINILRGTGRKGLTSIMGTGKIIRPLLGSTKQEIINYARTNDIVWREDITNKQEKYLRNYIRGHITTKLKPSIKAQLLDLINNMAVLNKEIDSLIDECTDTKDVYLNRKFFVSLPHKVAKEVLASWLRHNGIRSFKKSTLERLTVNAKIGTTGQLFPVQDKVNLKIYKDKLALE
jgi:tRNA(Ile)-lysidine synthase